MLLIPGVIVALLLSALIFGQVQGREFCPHDFSERTFYFAQIPIVRLQVTPVFRTLQTSDISTHLRTSNLLPQAPKPIRWDLTEGKRGSFQMATSGAEILDRYLTATDATNNSYWKQWSVRKPEEAKILWPVVAKLAHTKTYPLVPEAFEAARLAGSPAELKEELKKRLATQLHQRATEAQNNKQANTAYLLWDLAFELDPTQTEWRDLRDALPESAKPVYPTPEELKKADEEKKQGVLDLNPPAGTTTPATPAAQDKKSTDKNKKSDDKSSDNPQDQAKENASSDGTVPEKSP